MTVDELREGLNKILSLADIGTRFTVTPLDDRAVEYGRAIVESRVIDLIHEDFLASDGPFGDAGGTVTFADASGDEMAAIPPWVIPIFIEVVLPIIKEWLKKRRER